MQACPEIALTPTCRLRRLAALAIVNWLHGIAWAAPAELPALPASAAHPASAAKRERPLAAACRHSGDPAIWPTPRHAGASGAVERLLRETQRATGLSAATAVYVNHRTPRLY